MSYPGNFTRAAAGLAEQAGVPAHLIKPSEGDRVTVSDVQGFLAEFASRRLRTGAATFGQVNPTAYMGVLNLAHTSELRWPAAFSLFERIRRTDPEISIVRQMFTSLARSASPQFVPGVDDPTDGDKEAVEF